MKVFDFDFDLPEHLIALRPLPEREQARLLVVGADGSLDDQHISDLDGLIRPGDLVVVNNTKVLAAALTGRRARPAESTGAPVRIEINLNRALAPDVWQALVRPAKRLRVGDEVIFGDGELAAQVLAKGEGGALELRFDRAGDDLAEAVDRLGQMPLPPYIARRRAVDAADVSDYQTIFARETGAVAAPTAALHFTPELRARLSQKVPFEEVTLHVGAGTFLPVKADDTRDHKMHAERAIVDEATAAHITAHKQAGGRVVAIGTTSLRVLEAAAPAPGVLNAVDGETDIFITPGYQFKIVDALLTNFHLPRSTLFMLVSAFAGLDVMKRAYAHAVEEKYRFFSYGDACFLEGCAG